MTIAFRSATELAGMIRRREIGAVELLELCLGRIDALDATINSVIWQDREGALASARSAESRTIRRRRLAAAARCGSGRR